MIVPCTLPDLPAMRMPFAAISLTLSSTAGAAQASALDLTGSTTGLIALSVFTLAYLLVMAEERLQLRKSKPVLIAAGIIWALIGATYTRAGLGAMAEQAFRATLLEFAELMLFLLVAMTYVDALDERRLFDALRVWMMRRGFSRRTLFWLTGSLAFVISPVADNLTTALLLGAIVLKLADGDRRFINIACINIVVAANAGGAFSPFGDITSLMVWQAGRLEFAEFFALTLPALVTFVVPAALMSLAIDNCACAVSFEDTRPKRGAFAILGLFLLTIATAAACHTWLGLPPVLGMMTGLGYLQLFGYYLQRALVRRHSDALARGDTETAGRLGSIVPFDVFSRIARAEWDTLLFFYGVVMCVGGLGFCGYLALLSDGLYGRWDPTWANVALGMLSAVVDNIPLMFAVLTMSPDMSHGHWLLVTLTTGVGGSLLSVGSAAGVALMGQARGSYSFGGHLRWTPAILLGYVGGVATHLWLNADAFLRY